jgi:hypothetical protein
MVDRKFTHTSMPARAVHPTPTRMASFGGNAAVCLYEDVMRTMDAALRGERLGLTQPILPVPVPAPAAPETPNSMAETARALNHTLVMDAVHTPSPASSATRVVEVDPSKIEGSYPESERGPITVPRASSITLSSRPSPPAREPDPESTILLVTIEELEAEERGPVTERIPRVSNPPPIAELARVAAPAPTLHGEAGDRISGVQVIQSRDEQQPQLAMPVQAASQASQPPHPSYPAMAYAPVAAPAKKKSSSWIALVLLLALGLMALGGAGIYAARWHRAHHAVHGAQASAAGAGAVAAAPPAETLGTLGTSSTTTSSTTGTSPSVSPPPTSSAAGADAKPEESGVKASTTSSSSSSSKKLAAKKRAGATAKRAASNGSEVDAPSGNEDPTMLLVKGLDPATEL